MRNERILTMKELDILLEKYKQHFGEPLIPDVLKKYPKKMWAELISEAIHYNEPWEVSPWEWMDYYESYFKKDCPVPRQPFSVHDIPVADIKKALMENKPLPEIDWDYEHKIY